MLPAPIKAQLYSAQTPTQAYSPQRQIIQRRAAVHRLHTAGRGVFFRRRQLPSSSRPMPQLDRTERTLDCAATCFLSFQLKSGL
jgi:hypothetical protein